MQTWIALAWSLAAAIAVAGCAHTPRGHVRATEDGGDKICAGVVCYRVGALPDGWRMVHQEGASVGFFSEAAGAIIEANATCRDDADAAPLGALTRQLLIGYTERAIESQKTVPLDAREALRTRVTAKLDGVPMTLDLYVMKRDGCIFDLSLRGAAGDVRARHARRSALRRRLRRRAPRPIAPRATREAAR